MRVRPPLSGPRLVWEQRAGVREDRPFLAGGKIIENASIYSQNALQRGHLQTLGQNETSEVQRSFRLDEALVRTIEDHLARDPDTTPAQVFEALYAAAK